MQAFPGYVQEEEALAVVLA